MDQVVTVELSEDQERARDAIVSFLSGRAGDLLKVGGYAGTGKTTVVAASVAAMGPGRPKIGFCAFTGKAASVLRAKLERAGTLRETDYCGTIHGMIYEPFDKGGPKKRTEADESNKAPVSERRPSAERTDAGVGFKKRDFLEVDAIVVDEASMVREDIFEDMRSFGVPILAVGDHGQLFPVGDSFSLMLNVDVRLERIHRQALDNPIVRLSLMAREGGRIPAGVYGGGVEKICDRQRIKALEWQAEGDWMMLCGTNATRVHYNEFIRGRCGFSAHDPEPGERVVCLKNNAKLGVYNGMGGVIESVEPRGEHWYLLRARMDGGAVFDDWVLKHQFGSLYPLYEFENLPKEQIRNLFDWGYCLTVHKSQGSEADRVVVLEERVGRMSDDQWRRWLYTSITRARKELLIVGA